MIGYTTLGTNDMKRAAKFYDALLTEFGAKRAMETDKLILWGDPACSWRATWHPRGPDLFAESESSEPESSEPP